MSLRRHARQELAKRLFLGGLFFRFSCTRMRYDLHGFCPASTRISGGKRVIYLICDLEGAYQVNRRVTPAFCSL